MNNIFRIAAIVGWLILLPASTQAIAQESRLISRDELKDKIAGYWIGQCVGNFMGFPFEGTYLEKPVPVMVDHYYKWNDDTTLTINRSDLRGFCPIVINWLGGAFSDDDTDIEFVTLHALEQWGLDLTYKQITGEWKSHINRNIWCANRTARDLMDTGLLPPATGSKEHNANWYAIDPQLENELWSVIYPGMVRRGVARAEWGARITSDGWAVHPTIAYAVMYGAAFFENDITKLVNSALTWIPLDSPFREGMLDVINWHRQFSEWRTTRKMIFDKYYAYRKDAYQAPISDVSALTNGLFGIMALLYGDGDFLKTTGIAVSAGLDCDNQAATCAGLIGIMNGASAIPEKLTLGMEGHRVWQKPFNDTYINFTRDDLPVFNRISDLTDRILKIAERSIVTEGGRIIWQSGRVVYEIKSDL